MKISNSRSIVTLLASGLLVVSTVNALEMEPLFRDGNYKNIAFSALVGGSSHHSWVLSIVDELGQRGHNVSYLTTSQETRFGKPFENIKTIDIGAEAPIDMVGFMKDICAGMSAVDVFPKALSAMTKNFERDYFTFLSYFENNKIDVALCDHFVPACSDAATTLNIPYIITSTFDFTSESAAPYVNNNMNSVNDFSTEFESFIARFQNKFIAPLVGLYKFYPHIKDITARKRAIGIDAKFESPEDSWKDSIKLVNSLNGYIPARPIGPMSEYVGPIIPKKYKPMTGDLEQYFNTHKKIAYIAFGQSAIPSEQQIKLILTGLLESLEVGYLDGFLWATVNSAGFFPDSITTSSGSTYNVQEMFNHTNPHARMIKWAPQIAILSHSSTSVFVSHGGLGSWYESMYCGTPMIMFPFFGDQPGNALMIERSGLGGIIKKDASVKDTVRLFKKVIGDKDGEIRANIKRIQALTQIHSERGVMRGADIVEEVAYTHKNGKLPHRQVASNNMSYIKSHNLDLYATFIIIVTIILGLISFTSYKILSLFFNTKNQKIKTQ